MKNCERCGKVFFECSGAVICRHCRNGQTISALVQQPPSVELKIIEKTKYCPCCTSVLGISAFSKPFNPICTKCARDRSKRHYRKSEEKKYESHLIRRYGITLSDYNQILSEQNGVCASCGRPEITVVKKIGSLKKGKAKRLAVDHDHKTNIVRGLLCTRCNQALGYLFDDPSLILKLLNYCLKSKITPCTRKDTSTS